MVKIKDIETEEEFTEILESAGSKLVVADFWAEWCGPCRMIGPAFHKMAEEPEFQDVIFLKIDVDELGEMAQEYGITCMPTFIFFRNGEKIEEFSGGNKDLLRDLLLRHKNP